MKFQMKIQKIFYLIIGIIVVLAIIGTLFLKFYAPSAAKKEAEKNDMIRKAEVLYKTAKNNNIDIALGPCLGFVNDDWVVDLVHNPRTASDDAKENKCESYTLGQAKHFIELDLDGKLVRME